MVFKTFSIFKKKTVLLILERQLSASTTHLLSHKYQFDESDGTDICKLDNTDEDAVIVTTLPRVLDFEFAFCLAAFMSGPRNMRPARGVSSYKYPNSTEKVVSSGPNIE